MGVAFASLNDRVMLGPEAFSAAEVDAARLAGAPLQARRSRTAGRTYLVNACGRCDAFVGDFYLHDYWYVADEQPDAVD